MKIQAILMGDKVFSNSREAFNLFSEKRFGERNGEKIYYSLEEAYFLIKTKRMDLSFKNVNISDEEVVARFSKIDKKFIINFFVYSDLTKKGYIVKSGLKFGAVFRIYDKGKSLDDIHSKWICFPTESKNKNTWQDFASKNRVANSTKKKLLIAVVDEENDISYYESSWLKIN
jgi:tRNA-intron endonuclease, archaea type